MLAKERFLTIFKIFLQERYNKNDNLTNKML